jgi:hypothetical protein
LQIGASYHFLLPVPQDRLFLYYFSSSIPHTFELVFLGKLVVHLLNTAAPVSNGGYFPEILVALVLSNTIVSPDCCLLDVFVLEGMDVMTKNIVKASIMKDRIVLFSFRSAVSKEILDVTVIHFLCFCHSILTFH